MPEGRRVHHISLQICLLGIELRTSRRAASALNLWANSLAPKVCLMAQAPQTSSGWALLLVLLFLILGYVGNTLCPG